MAYKYDPIYRTEALLEMADRGVPAKVACEIYLGFLSPLYGSLYKLDATRPLYDQVWSDHIATQIRLRAADRTAAAR